MSRRPARAERSQRRRPAGARDIAAAALDVAGALVVVLDPQGRIVRFNHACERLTGLTFTEVAGRRFWDFPLVPEEAEAVRQALARVLESGTPGARESRQESRWENHWVAQDGSRRLVAWSTTAVAGPRGEVRLVVATGVDFTDQRRAESELRRHAARMKALADAARAFSSGLDYRTTLEAVVRRLGETVGDSCLIRVISDDGVWLEPVAFYHRDPAREALIRALQASAPQRTTEGLTARVLRQCRSLRVPQLTDEIIRTQMKAEYRPYLEKVSSFVAVPLMQAGRAFGHVTMLRDAGGPAYSADDEAFLEEVAVHAAQSIENARLYGVARAAVAARDEFLSVASHELRTPITALKLALQNLRRVLGRRESVQPPLAEETLATAERQSGRLETLVAALLDVSRIQAGRLDLKVEPLELGALVGEALANLDGQLAEARCPVTVHAPAPVLGRWDRFRVGQVITNLVSNALKYGEGKPIDIAVEARGDRACLKVKDHGIGIDAGEQSRLFERFARTPSARNYGGLGLGLYIVRRLVEAHGGAVRIESAAGEGSTFVVELPLSAPAPAAGSAAP